MSVLIDEIIKKLCKDENIFDSDLPEYFKYFDVVDLIDLCDDDSMEAIDEEIVEETTMKGQRKRMFKERCKKVTRDRKGPLEYMSSWSNKTGIFPTSAGFL